MTSEFLIMSNEQEKRKIPTQDILYIIISDYLSTFKFIVDRLNFRIDVFVY